MAYPVDSIRIVGNRELAGARQIYVLLVRKRHHMGLAVTVNNRPTWRTERIKLAGSTRRVLCTCGCFLFAPLCRYGWGRQCVAA